MRVRVHNILISNGMEKEATTKGKTKNDQEFAVIETGGKQYMVSVGDVLDVELLKTHGSDIIAEVPLEAVIDHEDDEEISIPIADRISDLDADKEQDKQIEDELAGENIGERDVIEEMEEATMEHEAIEGIVDGDAIEAIEEAVIEDEKAKDKE